MRLGNLFSRDFLLRPTGFLLAYLTVASCGALGSGPLEEVVLPHSGLGVFRPLEAKETGIQEGIAGQSLNLPSSYSVGGATYLEGSLFYAAAPLDPTTEPGDTGSAVNWENFQPRAIFRSEPIEGFQGYNEGQTVLSARDDWEGSAVFQPWAIRNLEGDVELYYSGDFGVGVARADGVTDTLSRSAANPLLGVVQSSEGAVFPRRPTAVQRSSGKWFLYFGMGNEIGVATSDNGNNFIQTTLTFTGPNIPIEPDSPEVSRSEPAVVPFTTAGGREVVRMYYVSTRADGQRWMMYAASADGVAFEIYGRPVLESASQTAPAPVILDKRTTLLFYAAPNVFGGIRFDALLSAVSPGEVTFAGHVLEE